MLAVDCKELLKLRKKTTLLKNEQSILTDNSQMKLQWSVIQKDSKCTRNHGNKLTMRYLFTHQTPITGKGLAYSYMWLVKILNAKSFL